MFLQKIARLFKPASEPIGRHTHNIGQTFGTK